jgi:hypothetical protein
VNNEAEIRLAIFGIGNVVDKNQPLSSNKHIQDCKQICEAMIVLRFQRREEVMLHTFLASVQGAVTATLYYS